MSATRTRGADRQGGRVDSPAQEKLEAGLGVWAFETVCGLSGLILTFAILGHTWQYLATFGFLQPLLANFSQLMTLAVDLAKCFSLHQFMPFSLGALQPFFEGPSALTIFGNFCHFVCVCVCFTIGSFLCSVLFFFEKKIDACNCSHTQGTNIVSNTSPLP